MSTGQMLGHGNNHTFTRFGVGAAVAVGDGGVEVDSVVGLKNVFIAGDFEGERAFHYVEKFDAGVLMRAGFVGGQLLEIGEECAQLALGGAIVEAFEVVGNVSLSGSFGKANALISTDYADDTALALVGEEV